MGILKRVITIKNNDLAFRELFSVTALGPETSKHAYTHPYAHIQAHIHAHAYTYTHTYRHTQAHLHTHMRSHTPKWEGRSGVFRPRTGGTARPYYNQFNHT